MYVVSRSEHLIAAVRLDRFPGFQGGTAARLYGK